MFKGIWELILAITGIIISFFAISVTKKKNEKLENEIKNCNSSIKTTLKIKKNDEKSISDTLDDIKHRMRKNGYVRKA